MTQRVKRMLKEIENYHRRLYRVVFTEFGQGQVLRTWDLELVHCQGKGEHKGVPQRVNWLEDADVLNQGLVPQVTHQESE